MKKHQKTETQLLLVDDEPIILNMLANGLNALGYKVTTQESPDAALDSYKRNPPDLVITDYRMPKMDGLQLAKAMIEIAHRPIIMLSAYNDLPLVREAIGAGISTYLVKPVEAERVAPSIEAALARFAEITALLQQGANIQAGVETHRLISTAVGIVMAKTLRPQDQAFESLRRLARDQRRPLRDVAFDLVDSISVSNTILSQLRSME
jgi:response regulator NasT